MFELENENTEQELFLEPITSNPLPENTTIGTELVYEDTLKGNVEENQPFILFELKKQYPDATYEQIMEFAKSPLITGSIKQKLKAEAQTTVLITEELTVPQTHSPISNQTEIEDSFFRKIAEKFDSTEESKVEVTSEELKGIKHVYIGGGDSTKAVENLYQKGIYGDVGNLPTYFTTDYAVACSHAENTLIEIELEKILKEKKIYRDPESLYLEDESGKTFIVANGIPANAIRKIYKIKKSSGSSEDVKI